MSPPGPRQIRIALLALVALAALILLAGRAPPAKVAVAFHGLDWDGIRTMPYGFFTLTNLSDKPLHWSTAVEIPDEPNFKKREVYSSFRPGGILAPSAADDFITMVTTNTNIQFRLTVYSNQRAPLLTRAWIACAKKISPLQTIWNPREHKARPIFTRWYRPFAKPLETRP